MKNIYTYLFLLCILFAGNLTASAQCDPILRPDSSQLIFNASVNSSAQVGNILYVGGNFTRISRNTGGFVKTEGTYTGNPIGLGNWPKTNGAVNAIVADGSGGWIIGGSFTQVGGLTRNRIAQINAAGQVTAWDPNASSPVSALFRNGTTLYIGGQFNTIGGQTRNRLASYNLITGLINAWDPNADGNVNTIVATGTDVYVGGFFTNVGGQSRNRIAAISAATGLATSWNPNVSTGSYVNKILLNGSTVYFGGLFNVAGGQTRNNIAAADATTGAITSWNPSSNSTVLDMIAYGSNIFVSGSFTNIGSQSRTGVAELDNTLGNATGRTFNLPTSTIYAIKVVGNYIYIGGNFTITATGQANLIKANLTTNTIDPWEANFNSTVYAIEPSGTDVYVAGNFTQHYRNRAYLAAIDVLTDELTSWAPNANGTVYAMAANATNVYIGGTFTTVSGTTRNRLAAISASGTLDLWNPNASSTVYSLLMNSGNLYVGGAFTTISSTTRNRIARYDIATNTLSTWNPSVNNGQVQSMTIAGSDIYVGGTFTAVSSPSTTRNRLAAFSTSTAALTGWNPAPDGNVNSVVASGSNIYVGGLYSNIGGQFSPRLAAVSQATGLASTWSPYPNNDIYYIAIEGNTLFAAGAFQTIGGQTRNNIAAVDLTTGNATTWDPSSNGIITYVAVHNDRLVLGGSYNTISGQGNTPFAAQYNLLSTTPVVSITGNNSVCAATSVTYTAVTSVTGATYQWKKNSLNVGTGATYTTVPVNGDQIQCVITTPIGSCYTTSTATSNTITVSVTSPVTPTISVTGSTSVCLSSSATYTATTNITGGTLQWKVNGLNVGTNSTSFTYTPNNGDVVTCTVTTPASGCFAPTTATSTPLNITVNTPVLPAISITTPNTTVCANASVTFTATTNVTGGTYQWKVNGVNAGTNSSTFSTTFTANSTVTCTITIPVGGCFTTSSVVSNTISMTVILNTVPTISIAGNISPCGSASATTYTATTNVTGGTYQWKVNGVNAGTNSSTYSYIPASGDVLTCNITAAPGTCYSPMSATSNTLLIIPLTPVVATAVVSGGNNLCSGQSGTYTLSTNVTGGTRQWKVNGINVSTSTSYTYIPVNGDVVTCVVTPPGSGCYTTSSVTSNSFTVTVNSPVLPNINITTANTTVCSGVPVLFDGTNNNVPGGTYQWKVNGNNIFGATNSTFTYLPVNGDIITCAITVPLGSCYLVTTSFSNQVTMNVTTSVTPTISVSASAASVCQGTVVNFTATSNISGSMQWKVNGANVGTGGSLYSYAPSAGDAITCEIAIPTTGCYTLSGTLISTPISVQVNTPVTPNISVAADKDTACEGSTAVLTATTNISGGTYLWKLNGVNAGTNSSTYSYVPQNNDIILCTIITPAGCYSASTATSPLKVMKVKVKQFVPSFTMGITPIVELGAMVYADVKIPSDVTNYTINWKRNGVTFAITNTNTASYVKAAGIDTVIAEVVTTDGCYLSTLSPERYVYSVGVGVNDVVKTSGIDVFPNPFNDRITVRGLADDDKLVLFDMAGRMITPAITKDNTGTTLAFSDIAPGAYILKVLAADGNVKANIPLRKM